MADSKKDIVYSAILESIINADYVPNQIITEKTLIERFGYSKAPIREALQQLCNCNLLRAIPRCGYEVVKVTRDDIGDALQVRYLLEGGMLKISLPLLTASNFQTLEQLNESCKLQTFSFWEHWDANTRFHLQLMAFSKNTYAYDALSRAMDVLKVGYAQFYSNSWNVSFVPTFSHSGLIAACKEKNIHEALAILRSDLSRFGFLNCSIGNFFELTD